MRAILSIALLALAGPTSADLVFRNATVLTITNGAIENGAVRISDGRIVAVGTSDEVSTDGADVVDLTGKLLMPGLVDTHSHIGLVNRPTDAGNDSNESTGPIQPALRAIDAVNPLDPSIRMARAGGVTTANIMPGSGNAMGGQTVFVKLRGETVDDMLLDPGGLSGGMKMANGENTKRNYSARKETPMTRMATATLQRNIFVSALNYRTSQQAAERDSKKTPPDRDLGLDAILEIIDRKRVVHFHSHRADDIMTAVRMSDEFGFRMVLQHGTESYKVADELARRNIPVSLTLVDSPGGKHEIMEMDAATPTLLLEAGVLVTINTDDWVTESRFLLRTAAFAVRDGMDRDAALAAITINGAQMLDAGERIGSIEVGKDADLVVLSGDPLSVYTRVLETWIDGVRVFDRANPADERYAVGGFAVADRYPVRETTR